MSSPCAGRGPICSKGLVRGRIVQTAPSLSGTVVHRRQVDEGKTVTLAYAICEGNRLSSATMLASVEVLRACRTLVKYAGEKLHRSALDDSDALVLTSVSSFA